MSLFQTSVIKKYLSELSPELIDKKYNEFQSYFGNPERQENIRNLKEEEFQEGFIRELFVNIFGYTLNPEPNYNIVLEKKNVDDSKKADGAIIRNNEVIAVIELKSTQTTNLDSFRDQAFGYKNHNPKCVYVITSNFEKIRLYINDATNHEEFDLFNLKKEDFSLLWLCFSKDNILNDIPLKIKEASVLQEENVTKKLYNDYSKFRTEIFEDIVKNNAQFDKLVLFKKTQKLLDRFLFIFFAEDRLLLPPNSISEIVKQWSDLKENYDEYFPLYDRFKKYFGYLNTGYKGKKYDIFPYNGGLFAPDEILDNIKISDELLHKHTLQLSTYDFETEVDVNILGHIFEHSLGEIENVQAEIAGEEIDRQKTKRKKDGIFYTPKYITKYIVENTVGKLCEEKRNEFGIIDEEYAKGRKNRKKEIVKELDNKLTEYREWLLNITILDPACGSGAFLNQALEFLIEEHKRIDELKAQLLGGSIVFSDIETKILEKNIYGVDLNEESVEIAKLSLWLRTAQKGRKLTTLSNHIKCGNSLIDDPEIAGEKAFNWQNEFPEVFANGGFDVVIGNPPYVFAREKISQPEKDYYSQIYKSADYQVNTYLLFIEKTIEIIKDKAYYGLIVPNAWLMVYSGQGLRKFILDTCKLNKIINLEGYSFEGVNVETIIILAKKEIVKENEFDIYLSQGKEFVFSHLKNQIDFNQNEGYEFKVFADDKSLSLIRKIQSDSIVLDNLVKIKAGLKAYQSGKGKPKQTAEIVKNRPFDFTYKYNEDTYKYVEGRDINRYSINWSGGYLWFGPHLAEPRMFSGPKIILREITGNFPKCLISTFTEADFLFNMSNIAILPDKESISLKYILSILNSSLLSFYFIKNTAKSVRKMFPKIILNDLRKFPIKEISLDKQESFINKVDLMLEQHQNLLNETTNFLKTLKEEKGIVTVNKKIESFFELTFNDFKKELKKLKIEFSFGTENDRWREYFNLTFSNVQQIQKQISYTDQEINQMVYELYGLTEEEIKIVEESN